jgi:hypothetical protein
MNEILKNIFKTGVLPHNGNIQYSHNIDNLFLKFDVETIKDFLSQKEISMNLDDFKSWFLEDTSNNSWNNLKKVFINNKRNNDMILFNRYD